MAACKPALAGTLPSACRSRGWHMREVALAVLPFVCHLTMVLHFCGGPGFLHEHFRLQSSSLPPLRLSPHSQQQYFL